MNVEFEDRLLTALLNEYESLVTPGTTLTGAASHGRRLLARPALFGAVGVAAAAAFAAVLVAGGTRALVPGLAHGRSASASARDVVPGVAGLVDVRYVVRKLNTALTANNDVLHEFVHAPDSQAGAPTFTESWSRGGTDTSHSIALNAQGQPVSAVLMTITPTETTSTTIDYASKTYTQHVYPFGSNGSGPAPAPATPTGQADTLRGQLAAGQVTLVGSATVDGQQTIELRDTSSPYGTIELWVDPATYLPVQEFDIPTGQTADSDQSIRTQYQWLPATQENLAELRPAGAIPAGFQPAAGA